MHACQLLVHTYEGLYPGADVIDRITDAALADRELPEEGAVSWGRLACPFNPRARVFGPSYRASKPCQRQARKKMCPAQPDTKYLRRVRPNSDADALDAVVSRLLCRTACALPESSVRRRSGGC
jgi:hypothetical protein